MLRPVLYKKLQRDFGKVLVVNPGAAMQSHAVRGENFTESSIDAWGESYRVNCDFCNDTRKRLYISHAWAQRKDGHWENLGLIKCFNEDCFKGHLNQGRRESFAEEIMGWGGTNRDELLPGTAEAVEVEAPYRPPGAEHNLLELAKRAPRHHALYYLEHVRGFDIREVSNLWGVTYCSIGDEEQRFGYASDRLIIPIYRDGQKVAWQARDIGDTHRNKYMMMRGMSKSRLLYNYDNARHFRTVVVCEGVTDVWRFGPEAVAIFGKVISPKQLALLGDWPQILLCLDAKEDVVEGKNVETAEESLRKLAGRSKYQILRLPAGTDPGSMDRQVLRDMAYGAMKTAGFEIDS